MTRQSNFPCQLGPHYPTVHAWDVVISLLRSPHANIFEGDLCREPFHMLLLLQTLLVLPDSPVTAAVAAGR